MRLKRRFQKNLNKDVFTSKHHFQLSRWCQWLLRTHHRRFILSHMSYSFHWPRRLQQSQGLIKKIGTNIQMRKMPLLDPLHIQEAQKELIQPFLWLFFDWAISLILMVFEWLVEVWVEAIFLLDFSKDFIKTFFYWFFLPCITLLGFYQSFIIFSLFFIHSQFSSFGSECW